MFTVPVASQENELLLEDASVFETVVEDNSFVQVFESDSAVEVDCNAAQCVSVKKSVLGCMEGITVLPQDEVWVINARECLCGETDLSLLSVSRLVESDLVPTDLSELVAAHDSGDGLATVLYIHGNQTDEEFAISRGLQVYRNAFAKKAHCHGPVRYVIWAWKSEQEKVRLYPDYVLKSERSVMLGETFAATLNQFNDRNIIVFGYSLGVQVALSAFDSPLLDAKSHCPSRYQVAFVAPAINADYIASHGLAMGELCPVDKTFVFTNRKDRAIRAAQAIIRRKSPSEEATIEGLANAGKLNLCSVRSIDVFEEAGRFHSVERYTRSETLQNMLADLVNSVGVNRATNDFSIE
jgi:hypothetical protein